MNCNLTQLIEAAGLVHEARHNEGAEVDAGLARAEAALLGLVIRLSEGAGVRPEDAGAGRFLPHGWRNLAR
jgi:hypothetical protein